MFSLWFSLYSVCCAYAAVTRNTTATALKIKGSLKVLVRIVFPQKSKSNPRKTLLLLNCVNVIGDAPCSCTSAYSA